MRHWLKSYFSNLRFGIKLFVEVSELYAGTERVYKLAANHPEHILEMKAIFLIGMLVGIENDC